MHRLPLFLLALAACAGDPTPDSWTEPVAHEVDHAWIWRGFHHAWSYNHRWSRLGGGVFVDAAGRPTGSMPESFAEEETSGWSYLATAGAGTGHDVGHHDGHAVRLEAAGVRLVAVTQRVELRGDDGRLTEHTARVRVPVRDELADLPVRGALLDGFWLDTGHGEAKQLSDLALHVGEPVRTDTGLAVDVDVALRVDCDTPECLGCGARPSSSGWADTFDYTLYVSLLLVLGEADEVEVHRAVGPEVAESWEGPPRTGYSGCLTPSSSYEGCLDYRLTCGDARLWGYNALDPSAGRAPLDLPSTVLPRRLVGLTGIELTTDEPHHMIDLELSALSASGADDDVEQVVRFQNWRHDMNEAGRDVDVRASTAFGTRGRYQGRLELAVLGLREASTTPWTDELVLVSDDVTGVRTSLDAAPPATGLPW